MKCPLGSEDALEALWTTSDQAQLSLVPIRLLARDLESMKHAALPAERSGEVWGVRQRVIPKTSVFRRIVASCRSLASPQESPNRPFEVSQVRQYNASCDAFGAGAGKNGL
jgi:hypothetical protein